MFSVSLGMATVIVPLLATAAGYQLGVVGFLIGVSAITQIVARAGMGVLMDRFSTRTFILASLLLLAASCAVLAASDALWAFIVSQLLQGAGRAYFFTGTQTHVVRGTRPAVSALAIMNVTNGIGLLVGPLLAGFIGDSSLILALVVAAAIAGVAILTCVFLVRYEPFVKQQPIEGEVKPSRMWRRSGVMTAGWMGAVAGAWRGILNSYLPLLITQAGHSIPVAGAMMTLANLAALGGSAVATPVRRLGIPISTVLGTALVSLGTAAMALSTANFVWSGIFLAISGIGAGVLQTLGPALGAESVDPQERGRSIAAIGTFRAISLLITPMGIGALVFVLPSAAVATAVVAVAVAVPAMVMRGSGSARS
nr:MFS transporter [Microbacterium pseudoresistens]